MNKYIDITFPYHSLADILESLSICGVKEVIMTNEDNKLKLRLDVDELSKLNYYRKHPKQKDKQEITKDTKKPIAIFLEDSLFSTSCFKEIDDK